MDDQDQCRWCWRIGPDLCPTTAAMANCQSGEAERFDGWLAYRTREESGEVENR